MNVKEAGMKTITEHNNKNKRQDFEKKTNRAY